MIKNEQSKHFDHSMRTIQSIPATTVQPQQLTMLQSTTGMIPKRVIDPNAIDLTSLKGRFAWEKFPQSDICMPVIFRYV
jgi:hypothetical protein